MHYVIIPMSEYEEFMRWKNNAPIPRKKNPFPTTDLDDLPF